MKWYSEFVLLRDHVLHPLIASVLPRSWSLRYADWLSTRASRLSAHGPRSRAGAEAALGAAADAAFGRRALWVRMLDLIDAPLSLLGADRHLRKYWRVHGQWPQAPCLAVSLHYGNGLFPLRHLRLSGHRAHMILERIQPQWFRGLPLTRAVVNLRRWCVERVMQGTVIFSGGARKRCLDAIAAGDSIFALLDNPQGLTRGIVPVDLFGRRIALHTGILQLAISRGLPIVPTLSMVGDGQVRDLHIGPSLTADTPEAICAQLMAWFTPLVDADPAAWHLWPQMGEFEDSVSALLADRGAVEATPDQPAGLRNQALT